MLGSRAAVAAPGAPSRKKGWAGGDPGLHRTFGAHWYLKDALRFLERSREVERYAYFEPGRGKPHSLLKEDGSLTRLGELYREAGAGR